MSSPLELSVPQFKLDLEGNNIGTMLLWLKDSLTPAVGPAISNAGGATAVGGYVRSATAGNTITLAKSIPINTVTDFLILAFRTRTPTAAGLLGGRMAGSGNSAFGSLNAALSLATSTAIITPNSVNSAESATFTPGTAINTEYPFVFTYDSATKKITVYTYNGSILSGGTALANFSQITFNQIILSATAATYSELRDLQLVKYESKPAKIAAKVTAYLANPFTDLSNSLAF